MRKILLLAGEESGLVYAERLRRELASAFAERGETVEFRGYQSEGFATSDLAVMGFLAVLARLRYFLGVQRTMRRVIDEWRPDAVVSIDYPGLNLKLAEYAKLRGIPAVHLVCPQVWAWHRGRIPRIAAQLTRLLCFFPFEPALFDGTGLQAVFIGHPMVDFFAEERRGAASAEAEASDGVRTLALLPGSRTGEITRILPRLLATLDVLAEKRASRTPLRVVIPAANEKARALIESMLDGRGRFPVEIRDGGAREILRRADCAAVASGTATLEAALARCPTVLVYAVSPFFAWFVRHFVKGTKYIGLANIIATRAGLPPPMPELLQEGFTPAATAARLAALLDDDETRRSAVEALDRTMLELKSDGAAMTRAAREILSCVSR